MLVLVLPATVAFSLMKVVEAGNIGVQEPKGFMSKGTLLWSIPFYVDNSGFYDLTDVGLKLHVYLENETILTVSAEMPNIPAGGTAASSCNLSISLAELVSKHKEILTVDAGFNVCVSLRFRVASAIALSISTNTTMPWGAPFHELAIRDVSYDHASRIFSASLNFNNHAFFQVNETLMVKLYSFEGEPLDSTFIDVNVPPGGTFKGSFMMRIDDPSKLARGVFIRLYYLGVQILEVEWLP